MGFTASQAFTKWFFLRAAGAGAVAYGVTEGFWDQLRNRIRSEQGPSAITASVTKILQGNGDAGTVIGPLPSAVGAAAFGYGIPYLFSATSMPFTIPYYAGLSFMMTAPQLAQLFPGVDEKGNPTTPRLLRPRYGAYAAAAGVAGNVVDWAVGHPVGNWWRGAVPEASEPMVGNPPPVPEGPSANTWMQGNIAATFATDLGAAAADFVPGVGESDTKPAIPNPLYDATLAEKIRRETTTTKVMDAAYLAARMGSLAVIAAQDVHNPVFWMGTAVGAWLEFMSADPEMLKTLPPVQQAMVMQLMGSKVAGDTDVYQKLSTEKKCVDLGVEAAKTGTRLVVNGMGVVGKTLVGGVAGYEAGRLAVYMGKTCISSIEKRWSSWLSDDTKETLKSVASAVGATCLLAAVTKVTGWW